MKIKSLKLTDFKGFEQLHIESFGKQTTAIVGNNGAGKSSIIEAIDMMFFYLLRYNWAHKYDESIIRNNSKRKIADITIEFDVDSKPVKQDLKFNNKKQLYSKDYNEKKALGEKFRSSYEKNGISQIVISYPPSRIINNFSIKEKRIQDQINNNLEDFANLVLESVVNYREFVNWFEKMENHENEIRLNEDNNFRIKELEALRKAYRIFFPEFKKLRMKRTSDADWKNPQLIFENNEKIFSFKQLSDGEQGVIALIGDIVKRLSEANPKLDNPLQGEAIIMIDEIELHLHPTWQRKIIKKLEAIFPNCQFIITTHSPQVLSELDGENDKIIAIKNFKAYEIPTVFGRETNWILETVMDTPARPSEFKNQLRDYFDLIANDKLKEAEALRIKLEKQTGSDEPEFVKADMLIRRKKAMKK